MAQPAEQIGQDLSTVHSFYLFLLESALGHEVPVPPSISHDAEVLHRFVLLLDLAVSPQMIRDGLKSEEQRATAEALLRFFAGKPRRRHEDRDKVDVIATALYRMDVPEGTDLADEGDRLRIQQFEGKLRCIYKALPTSEPPTEHKQLVREFQFLRDEASDFRHFDELIDSGVIQKVRDMKQTLDASFLHPGVLATVASYNVFFGERFDALFKRAAKEVKMFAAKVQQDGGSIMSRVDGDVIVKQLAEVDEGKILNEEYNRAQEDLRHMSKLKKAVDNRRFGKTAAPPKRTGDLSGPIGGGTPPLMPLSEPVVPVAAQAAVQVSPRLGPVSESTAYAVPRSSSSIGEVEQQRLHGVMMAIRSFVRAADPKAAHVVPLPNGNITLSNAETEAFRTDYGNEKSFRADYVSTVMQISAVDARFAAELQELENTRYTAYNWKPHADSLAHLLQASRTLSASAMHLHATALQRGLTDKVTALDESVEKMRARAQAVAEALQSVGSGGE